MILSASVMAHERRSLWVSELLDSLDRPVPVAWDRESDVWETGSRAWALFDPRADWHLVIQDDVRVVPDLLARTAALLDGLEHRGPVSLYIGRGRPRQAAVRRAVADSVGGWVTMPWLLWGPAFALPTAQIPRMLAACRVGSREYDRRISNYFERQHIPTLYTLPCLVDHRDEGSLLGHDRGVERRAWEWAGESTRA